MLLEGPLGLLFPISQCSFEAIQESKARVVASVNLPSAAILGRSDDDRQTPCIDANLKQEFSALEINRCPHLISRR